MHEEASALKEKMPIMSHSDNKPRSLADILAGTSVAGLARRAAATDKLARRVRSALPREVGAHVIGANLRGNRLVVIVDGAVWAARVRFELDALRIALGGEQELEVAAVTVKVRAPDAPG